MVKWLSTAAMVPHATDEDIKTKMEPYVMALGKVAHAWNYLQEALGQLFCAVTGLEQDNAGQAIWHSTSNDRAQRNMLSAALAATQNRRLTFGLPKAKDDLNWLLEKANKVAEQRNNAIHAPMAVAIGGRQIELVPVAHHGNPRAYKLVGKDIITEFEWYEQCADTLTRFARSARTAIASDAVPWPDRPQLPVLQQKKAKAAWQKG
jgi:hypothetical protein